MDNGGGGGEGCNTMASKLSSIFKISSPPPPLVLLPIGIKFGLVRISCGQFLKSHNFGSLDFRAAGDKLESSQIK